MNCGIAPAGSASPGKEEAKRREEPFSHPMVQVFKAELRCIWRDGRSRGRARCSSAPGRTGTAEGALPAREQPLPCASLELPARGWASSRTRSPSPPTDPVPYGPSPRSPQVAAKGKRGKKEKRKERGGKEEKPTATIPLHLLRTGHGDTTRPSAAALRGLVLCNAEPADGEPSKPAKSVR